MATNNQGQTAPAKDACEDVKNTRQILLNSKQELCNELRDAVDNLREAEGTFWGSVEVYKYKKCLYLKSNDSWRFYRNIEISTSNCSAAEAGMMKEKVKKAGERNVELQKLLKEVAKNVSEAHIKFKALNGAACALKRCMDDTCNGGQRKLLVDKLKEDNKDHFTEAIECLLTLSDSVYHTDKHKDNHRCPDDCYCDENINELLCFTADVVGMQTFSNIENLSAIEKGLNDAITEFHNNVSGNLKAGADDAAKGLEELLKFQQTAAKLKYELFEKRGLASGIKDSKDFVCDPKCVDMDRKNLCREFPAVYCGDGSGKSAKDDD